MCLRQYLLKYLGYFFWIWVWQIKHRCIFFTLYFEKLHLDLIDKLPGRFLNSWPISYRVLLMCLSKLSWLVSILITFEHCSTFQSLRHIFFENINQLIAFDCFHFHGWWKINIFSLHQEEASFYLWHNKHYDKLNWSKWHFFLKGNISSNEWIFSVN